MSASAGQANTRAANPAKPYRIHVANLEVVLRKAPSWRLNWEAQGGCFIVSLIR
jgi:hypothetical protein